MPVCLPLCSDILFLKHVCGVLRQSSNPVCGFSMMEQVRLCAVSPTENWLGSSRNHIQGWMTVGGCCMHAFEKGCLTLPLCFVSIWALKSLATTTTSTFGWMDGRKRGRQVKRRPRSRWKGGREGGRLQITRGAARAELGRSYGIDGTDMKLGCMYLAPLSCGRCSNSNF